MGNIIVQQGKLRLYKTQPSVMIRLPQPYGTDHDKQLQIFSLLKQWESAGFKFELNTREVKDTASEMNQERQAQELKWRTGQKIPYGEQTLQQELHLYIDFTTDDAKLDEAFQNNWKSPFREDESSRIYIGTQRDLLPEDILHETGHSLGFAHEHQRIDRDLYVKPTDQNKYEEDLVQGIQIGAHSQMQSVPFGPYDRDSIMHYPGIFSTLDNAPIGGTPNAPIFPNTLSVGDIHTAHFLYNESRIYEHLCSNLARTYGEITESEQFTEKKLQIQRHKILMPPYTHSNHVIMRTFEVVNNQLDQLKRLKLSLTQQDNALFHWAKHHRDIFQQQQAMQQNITLWQQQPAHYNFPSHQTAPQSSCCNT